MHLLWGDDRRMTAGGTAGVQKGEGAVGASDAEAALTSAIWGQGGPAIETVGALPDDGD